jgi:hypothetical protein
MYMTRSLQSLLLTARRGDRVGGFTLRHVGIESVEVAGEAGITRVPLGGN